MWVIRQCDFSGAVKPKSVIRPCMDFLDYFLRSFGFYKNEFCLFLIRNSSLSLIKRQAKFILLKFRNTTSLNDRFGLKGGQFLHWSIT